MGKTEVINGNLSKKELQDLCRTYGISPYDTKHNLLKSLRSHLKDSDMGNEATDGMKYHQQLSDLNSKSRQINDAQNVAQQEENSKTNADIRNSKSGRDGGLADNFGSQCDSVPLVGDAAPGSLKSSSSAPSFQFSVSSEKGISLYVDLNSDLSDWSKRLGNELCICQNLHKSTCQSFCQELRFSENNDKQVKSSIFWNTDYKINNLQAHTNYSPNSSTRIDGHLGMNSSTSFSFEKPHAVLVEGFLPLEGETNNSLLHGLNADIQRPPCTVNSCAAPGEKERNSSCFHASVIEARCNSVENAASPGLGNTLGYQNVKFSNGNSGNNDLQEPCQPDSLSAGMASDKKNRSDSSSLQDVSLDSFVNLHEPATVKIGMGNCNVIDLNASSIYERGTAQELERSNNDKSNALRTEDKRLGDSVSGRGCKRKRADGECHKNYVHDEGRMLRRSKRLSGLVLPRRSVRLVAK